MEEIARFPVGRIATDLDAASIQFVIKNSRKMPSYLLRHDAQTVELLDTHGYASLTALSPAEYFGDASVSIEILMMMRLLI